MYDPLHIGDKAKWFSHSLQKIDFYVYDENGSTLGAAVEMNQENRASDDIPTGKKTSLNFLFPNLKCTIRLSRCIILLRELGGYRCDEANILLWIDESGSDSDGAESTSSSYSSLSDFVIDIQNSDINGDTPGKLSFLKE